MLIWYFFPKKNQASKIYKLILSPQASRKSSRALNETPSRLKREKNLIATNYYLTNQNGPLP